MRTTKYTNKGMFRTTKHTNDTKIEQMVIEPRMDTNGHE